MNPETSNERAHRYERWLLCAILLEPKQLSRAQCKREHFLTTGHGDVFQAMCNLAKSKEVIDIVSVVDEVERISPTTGQFIYIATLLDEMGVVPENVVRYSREVAAAAHRREFHKCREELALAENRAEQMKLLDRMRALLGAKYGGVSE